MSVGDIVMKELKFEQCVMGVRAHLQMSE